MHTQEGGHRTASPARDRVTEFSAWALIYQAESGDTADLPWPGRWPSQVANRVAQEWAAALG